VDCASIGVSTRAPRGRSADVVRGLRPAVLRGHGQHPDRRRLAAAAGPDRLPWGRSRKRATKWSRWKPSRRSETDIDCRRGGGRERWGDETQGDALIVCAQTPRSIASRGRPCVYGYWRWVLGKLSHLATLVSPAALYMNTRVHPRVAHTTGTRKPDLSMPEKFDAALGLARATRHITRRATDWHVPSALFYCIHLYLL